MQFNFPPKIGWRGAKSKVYVDILQEKLWCNRLKKRRIVSKEMTPHNLNKANCQGDKLCTKVNFRRYGFAFSTWQVFQKIILIMLLNVRV